MQPKRFYVTKIFKFRVKSCKFGRSIRTPTLFISYFNYWNKNKLTIQTVKILIRRLIKSRFICIFNVFKCMSEFFRCPKLLDLT